MPFGKILIARRGEAAARVARTCRRLGIETVALYSERAESVHVEACDEAVKVVAENGRVPAAAVIEAARATGVDAIYPGYASYTMHLDLAERAESEDFVCIGVDPELLRLVRDRAAVATLAEEAGASPVPWVAVEDEKEAYRHSDDIGYPLLVKGPLTSMGVGRHVADDDDETVEAFRTVRKIAPEGKLILERGIQRARDIEVLVACDTHGEVIAICEQETSIVSAGRGLLRECPSPELVFRGEGEAIREMMYDVAIRLGSRVACSGLLGVRLLLDPAGRFFVRGIRLGLPNLHAAAEMVTGLDLVELQIRIAAGEPIPDEVRHLEISGHAVSAQVLAAGSPTRDTVIEELRFPNLPHRTARVEPSVMAGCTVPPDDWPRLAKVSCTAPIRHQALLSLDRLLAATEAPPLASNVDVIRGVLVHEGFRAGQYDCSLVETLERSPVIARPLPPVSSGSGGDELDSERGDRRERGERGGRDRGRGRESGGRRDERGRDDRRPGGPREGGERGPREGGPREGGPREGGPRRDGRRDERRGSREAAPRDGAPRGPREGGGREPGGPREAGGAPREGASSPREGAAPREEGAAPRDAGAPREAEGGGRRRRRGGRR